MKIIDNSASLNYDQKGDDRTFLPAATFGFVNSTKVLTITEAGSVPAGDTFARMNVEVFDKNGNSKTGTIAAAAGNVAIDLDAATALDLTGDINIKVTAATTKGLAKDGAFYGLKPIADASGSLTFEK